VPAVVTEPRRGDIVAHGMGGGFAGVNVGGDGERASGVGVGDDEIGLDPLAGRAMRCATEVGVAGSGGRLGGRAIRREPNSTGAGFGGVASTDLGGRGWNDFGDAGRAGCNILREFPEIFDLIADACSITVAKGQLQVGEHAVSARDGEDRAAQLAQKAVPHFDRDSRPATHFGKDFEQQPQLAGEGGAAQWSCERNRLASPEQP
jgi:hypothetical protein